MRAWNSGSLSRSRPRRVLQAAATMMPMKHEGMVTATICGIDTLKPLRAEMAEKATTAAEMGEQMMAIMEATLATAQGRSGRMPFLMATSAMMGISVYITCPVPTKMVSRKVETGARKVICWGCLRSIFSAIWIIQSMPPEACRMPAQVTAATMM